MIDIYQTFAVARLATPAPDLSGRSLRASTCDDPYYSYDENVGPGQVIRVRSVYTSAEAC